MNDLLFNGSTAVKERTQISADLLTDFLLYVDRSEATRKTYIKSLKQFFAFLKFRGISEPSRADIIAYKEWLLSEHEAITLDADPTNGWAFRTDKNGRKIIQACKPKTANIYLQTVKQFFKWSAYIGIYPNIAENIHPPRVKRSHRKEALTVAQNLLVEKAIKEAQTAKEAAQSANRKDTAGRVSRATEQGARLNAMYQLAVNAGLRTIELSRANIGDLEQVEGQNYLYVWGKGDSGANVKVPIAAEVRKAIDEYLERRTDAKTPNAPLFVATGNRSGGKRLQTTAISRMLKQALKDAGLDSERLTAHSLRHTTASQIMKISENNIYATQHYLRHSNPATTEIYLQNDTFEQNCSLADNLYTFMHAEEATQSKPDLSAILNSLSAEQRAELIAMATA